MPEKAKPNLAKIKLLVVDVDGVLTDGTVAVNADGDETKFFNAQDGHGIRLWRRAGLKVAVITGTLSPAAAHRAEKLQADYLFQDCHYKLPVLRKLLQELNLSPQEVACIGDDLPDLPMITYVGFGAAVANAVDEVRQHADYITTNRGGCGAVREVIELILKTTDSWQHLMKRYLPE
jgi:3-deoxy-D-manno-octulosonate 8-phosphate phosphatase (KDO 8-P phosphatase)